MRLLIYALGGGRGHLTRGLALGRGAAQRGHQVHLLSNSPYARAVGPDELGPNGRLEAIAPTASRDECASLIDARLRGAHCDALIVDTFPRGLGGELAHWIADLPCARVWVHRDLNQRYVDAFDLRAFAKHYDLILGPGERGPLDDLPQVRRTAPWLVRDARELRPRAAARRALGAEGSAPLVGVVGTGKREEIAAASRRAARLSAALGARASVRFLTDRWPLLELLPGVDVLVGAGGYNTVHEARATGTSLVAIPQARLYDRQEARLRPAELSSERSLVRDVLARLAERPAERRSLLAPRYVNGVARAVEHVEHAVERRAIGTATWQ